MPKDTKGLPPPASRDSRRAIVRQLGEQSPAEQSGKVHASRDHDPPARPRRRHEGSPSPRSETRISAAAAQVFGFIFNALALYFSYEFIYKPNDIDPKGGEWLLVGMFVANYFCLYMVFHRLMEKYDPLTLVQSLLFIVGATSVFYLHVASILWMHYAGLLHSDVSFVFGLFFLIWVNLPWLLCSRIMNKTDLLDR